MAREMQAAGLATGLTLYAILRNTVLQVWNPVAGPAAFVAPANAQASYAIAVVESALPGYYSADFPGGIPAGYYSYEMRKRLTGVPLTTDPQVWGGDIEWSGTAVIPRSTPNALADAYLDRADGVETSLTPRQWMRLMRAILVGVGTESLGTYVLKRKDGVTTAITITHDGVGNRTASVEGTL